MCWQRERFTFYSDLMPDLANRDPEYLKQTLTRWFATQLPESADPLCTEVSAPGGNGFSNETIMATISWIEDGVRSAHKKVLRVHPTSHTLFLDARFELQYKVMAAVAASPANLPVPVLGAYETDPEFLGVPFFVMDHVEGQVPADNLPYTMDGEGWVLKATDEERERLWWSGLDALAEIAKIDHTTLGLDFLDRPEYGKAGIDQQLGYYRAFLDASSGGRPQPSTEAIWQWLIDHRPTTEGPLGFSWGDARIGNIIWDNFAPAAVVDWEMASFAPAELDLGWFLYFNRQFTEGLGLPPVPGFASREASIARFETAIGRQVHDLEWFEVFAGFRFGVIMLRLTDLLIGSGVLPADTDMGTNNLATQFTSMLLGHPTPAEMDAAAKA